MHLADVLSTLKRRWLLVLVGVLVTLVGCVAVARVVPPKYTLTANVLLLPPQTVSPQGSNPLLVLGDLNTVADVLSRSMTDDESISRMRAQGAVETFSATRDQTTSAPLLQTSATAKTLADAKETLDIITNSVPERLNSIQSALGVQPAAVVTSTVLTNNNVPEVSRKTQIQGIVGAAALGLFSTLLFVSVVDRRRQSRRGRGSSGALPESSQTARGTGAEEQRSKAGGGVCRAPELSGHDHDELSPKVAEPHLSQRSRQ